MFFRIILISILKCSLHLDVHVLYECSQNDALALLYAEYLLDVQWAVAVLASQLHCCE